MAASRSLGRRRHRVRGRLRREDREIQEAVSTAVLVVPARYDGVDLPGDSCRVLVIDDLPTGMTP